MASKGGQAEALKKLEYLPLLSKICTELESHLGVGDKVLGEFLIEMGKNCEEISLMPNLKKLSGFNGKEGLVHVSQMARRQVANARNVVKRDQEVYVKVVSMNGKKLGLSMKDVDRNTGEDLITLKKNLEDGSFRANPSSFGGPISRRGINGIRISDAHDSVLSRRPKKRMSSPERW
ncbi:OLC1v1000930C1 [Oldenlandia corymbosa var. corymbosa]|uniref:OLC1v1000930C1 n=1 Tax=Oldenlandia corymbosa var. corymbosa TaxID=529605 RepID=A0AAV1D4Y5_OLDCO|nr:OLC1v1000930C1 [Oldenlandia corymbosa var. corymbosa]